MTNEAPYNPLDKRNLGASVANALLTKLALPLEGLPSFKGAGIYAIYYAGDFPAYAPIADRNRDYLFEAPIYVGKAVPKGARKGNVVAGAPTGTALRSRLRKHATSITEAENLALADFHCRFLVVEDIWIALGEALLVARFSPLWNKLVDGFGNNTPGKGRYEQLRSRWDVLHPGRPWAYKCQERHETAEQIATEVVEYLRSTPPPKHSDLFDVSEFDVDDATP